MEEGCSSNFSMTRRDNMSVCIHGNLCREILHETGYIYSRTCPKNCSYFEEKYPIKPVNSDLKVKRIDITLESDDE